MSRLFRSTGCVFSSRSYVGSVEPPATVLEDESRFGNDGAFASDGHPDWVQLPSGLWVMSFDGTGDKVLTGSPVLVRNAFTGIAWWKRIGASGGAVGAAYHTLLTALNGKNDYNGFLVASAGTACRGDVKTNVADYASTNVVISAADWHLVGWKWDGSNVNTLTDGAVSANVATTGTLNSGTTGFRMGRWLANDNYYLANGYMIFHRVFNYAISAERFASIYQAERHWFGV